MKKNIIIDGYFDLDDLITLAMASKKNELNIKAVTGIFPKSKKENFNEIITFINHFIPNCPVAVDFSMQHSNLPYLTNSLYRTLGFENFNETHDYSLTPRELLFNTLKESSEKITLIALGNLQNIESLIFHYPLIKEKIEMVLIVGGASNGGDITPCSEFSIHQHAESANALFQSKIPCVICGLDVIHKAIFSPFEIEKFSHFKTQDANIVSTLASTLLSKEKSHWEYGGISLYGATALAYTLLTDIFTERECYVAVETKGALTLGQTVVDFHNILKKENNAILLTDVNHSELIEFCVNSFK